jgi:hypothetical protein
MMFDGRWRALKQSRISFFGPSGSRKWLRGSLANLLERRLLGHAIPREEQINQ